MAGFTIGDTPHVPRLPQPRPGETLIVKGRPLTFSLFPVRRQTRRYGLSDVVFAIDPWAVIEGAVNDRVAATDRHEALAFVAQARAFFDAASARTPLLDDPMARRRRRGRRAARHDSPVTDHEFPRCGAAHWVTS